MNAQKELKLLKQLNELLTNEQQETRRQSVKRKIIQAVSWVGLVAAFMLVMSQEPVSFVAVVLASIAGAFAGIAIYADAAVKQWPIIKPHINNQSVAEKVKQLEHKI